MLRAELLPTGWVDNKVCAIDDEWSGLRFVLRKELRPGAKESKRPGEKVRKNVSSGLIVGRFNPPHLGHSFMIDWAAERVERLVVFVNTRDGELVPGELRAAWLAELHPDVIVVEVRHDLDTELRRRGAVGRVDGAVPLALAARRRPATSCSAATRTSSGIAERFGAEAGGGRRRAHERADQRHDDPRGPAGAPPPTGAERARVGGGEPALVTVTSCSAGGACAGRA